MYIEHQCRDGTPPFGASNESEAVPGHLHHCISSGRFPPESRRPPGPLAVAAMPRLLPILKAGPPAPAPVEAAPKAATEHRRPAGSDSAPAWPKDEEILILPKSDEDTVCVLRSNKWTAPYIDSATNEILEFLGSVHASDNPSSQQAKGPYRFVEERSYGLGEALIKYGFMENDEVCWCLEMFVPFDDDFISVVGAAVGGDQQSRTRTARIALALQAIRLGAWHSKNNQSIPSTVVPPRPLYDLVRFWLPKWDLAESSHETSDELLAFPDQAAGEAPASSSASSAAAPPEAPAHEAPPPKLGLEFKKIIMKRQAVLALARAKSAPPTLLAEIENAKDMESLLSFHKQCLRLSAPSPPGPPAKAAPPAEPPTGSAPATPPKAGTTVVTPTVKLVAKSQSVPSEATAAASAPAPPDSLAGTRGRPISVKDEQPGESLRLVPGPQAPPVKRRRGMLGEHPGEAPRGTGVYVWVWASSGGSDSSLVEVCRRYQTGRCSGPCHRAHHCARCGEAGHGKGACFKDKPEWPTVAEMFGPSHRS